jgi:hypothetical protein
MDFDVNPDRPGDATVDERFFRKACLQGLLTDINNPSSSNTVPLRGYKKGDKHKHYIDKNKKGATETHWRLYPDLLHAGDLDNLIEEHTVKDKDDSDKKIQSYQSLSHIYGGSLRVSPRLYFSWKQSYRRDPAHVKNKTKLSHS